MFEYTWEVTVTSNRELSEDAQNVISDMKAEFADAVRAIVELDFDSDDEPDEGDETGTGQEF